MFTLYCLKGAGSAAVEALLAETDLPHQLEDVERNADKTFPAWFLKINPAAQIPALRLPDDSVMTESAAMMIYLADLVPQRGLAPGAATPARAQYLRWMLFLATAVYETDLRYYYPHRYVSELAHAASVKEKADHDMTRHYGIIANANGFAEGQSGGPELR